MAPSFGTSADDVPVETQLLLVEMCGGSALSSALSDIQTTIFGQDASRLFPTKQYAAIIPLIDFEKGFRSTLFGKEGGFPAGKGMLAGRMESGDASTTTSSVKNAFFITTGREPYEMLRNAYRSISTSMGSFKTRAEKPTSPGVDSFGFCTWDAFYSSVDTNKVMNAVKSLSNIGFSPKFVIIDDGWQSVAPSLKYRNTDQASKDGDLSGAQIDGKVAMKSTTAGIRNPILQFLTKEVLRFYSEKVEKGKPNSLAVKLWGKFSQTLLKQPLLDFFALQTDFSKRLTSWRANSKFEDMTTGKTLRQFVSSLKTQLGIKHVFVWHALSGYWGGISENSADDLPKRLKGFSNGTDDTAGGVTLAYSNPTPHLLMVEPALAWDPGSIGTTCVNTVQSTLYEAFYLIVLISSGSGAGGDR